MTGVLKRFTLKMLKENLPSSYPFNVIVLFTLVVIQDRIHLGQETLGFSAHSPYS